MALYGTTGHDDLSNPKLEFKRAASLSLLIRPSDMDARGGTMDTMARVRLCLCGVLNEGRHNSYLTKIQSFRGHFFISLSSFLSSAVWCALGLDSTSFW